MIQDHGHIGFGIAHHHHPRAVEQGPAAEVLADTVQEGRPDSGDTPPTE